MFRQLSLNRSRPLSPRAALRVNNLESRLVPAAFTVTNGLDSGAGSLRAAITQANATAGVDTITFAASVSTVALNTASLDITETGLFSGLVIDGGAKGVTISRETLDVSFSLFTVAANANGTFKNLTMTKGGAANGGAIENKGSIQVIGCTLTGNSATAQGGAIWTSGLFPSYIINSTLSGNSSSQDGGAIWHGKADLFITNCTFYGNQADPFLFNAKAPSGGALFTNDQAGDTINNSIFADNTSQNVSNEFGGTPSAASFNNIITDAKTAGGMTILNNNAIGVKSDTFMSKTLADNGGPTFTHNILANSIAHNGGANFEANDAEAKVLTVDQRGFARFFDTTIDVGAVELQSAKTAAQPPANPGGPVANPAAFPLSIYGAAAGGGSHVKVYNTVTGALVYSFTAFDKFNGGVQVATGSDITGDGQDDFVVAAGAGGGPHVKVYDGATGKLYRQFYAYDPKFGGGVSLSMTDLNDDGIADIITGPGAGGGPHVKVFDGKMLQNNVANDTALISQFSAFDTKFLGGISVTTGDLNGDGKAEVVVGAGPGGGPHVIGFDVFKRNAIVISFMAYDKNFKGGVQVAVGDVDGDGKNDIITGAGAGGASQVIVYNGQTGALKQSFLAYEAGFRGGVNVTVADVNNDNVLDVVVGPKAGRAPAARAYNGKNSTMLKEAVIYDPAFLGGMYVG